MLAGLTPNIFVASIVVNIFSTGLVIRERGRLCKSALADLSDDENVRGMSRETRRYVYERSLDPEAMERARKLSSGSIRVERQIEAIRWDAYAALRSIPEYRALKASDQKVAQDLVNEAVGSLQNLQSGRPAGKGFLAGLSLHIISARRKIRTTFDRSCRNRRILKKTLNLGYRTDTNDL